MAVAAAPDIASAGRSGAARQCRDVRPAARFLFLLAQENEPKNGLPTAGPRCGARGLGRARNLPPAQADTNLNQSLERQAKPKPWLRDAWERLSLNFGLRPGAAVSASDRTAATDWLLSVGFCWPKSAAAGSCLSAARVLVDRSRRNRPLVHSIEDGRPKIRDLDEPLPKSLTCRGRPNRDI